MKFACGGSTGGFIYPIGIMISNLSKVELPSNDLSVIPIKGLSINCNIDLRDDKVSYLCIMGNNFPQKYFFAWFYEKLTYQTVLTIRKLCKPISVPIGEDEGIPVD